VNFCEKTVFPPTFVGKCPNPKSDLARDFKRKTPETCGSFVKKDCFAQKPIYFLILLYEKKNNIQELTHKNFRIWPQTKYSQEKHGL